METLYGSFQKRKGTILMSGFEHKTEIAEAERSIQKSEAFREIKPEKEISFEEVQAFWDNFFDGDIEEGEELRDDNGKIYSIDGKLQPDTTYELNGNIYTTDENGRIINCEAKPIRSPENPRDSEAQRRAGGEDRRPDDQGGHIIGRDLNGDGGIGNLVPMDSKINQSDYKRMENEIKTALDEEKDVTTKTEITYSGDCERPDIITVTITADGKDTVFRFDNNLDGSLRDEVPESGKEIVQDRLKETGGEISSVKKEYEEDGTLAETTVYITYKGKDGVNYRTSVIIENQ